MCFRDKSKDNAYSVIPDGPQGPRRNPYPCTAQNNGFPPAYGVGNDRENHPAPSAVMMRAQLRVPL
jgi:hypothetical protein